MTSSRNVTNILRPSDDRRVIGKFHGTLPVGRLSLSRTSETLWQILILRRGWNFLNPSSTEEEGGIGQEAEFSSMDDCLVGPRPEHAHPMQGQGGRSFRLPK